MGANLDITQAVAHGSRLAQAGVRIGAPASAVLRRTAFAIEADAKALIVAMDAVDTGDMLNSVTTEITGDGRSGSMSAEVGPTVDYGIYVHEGTSVMAGRPYLANAFDRQVPGFQAALAQLAAAGT
ncbi:hypothetical protein NPS01_25490 [Nocardioides psychrotolerans]|uniref:Uncharacterized protein n=1 Tax=Nocardioides psychrotolerans TaxID=1005945 RepID=A0A1I3LQV5_9ACTN|nr:HK97 gp10 family phage protein [Nocardioides psychrotolerans]GEP38886.1 hypothetical protein NPS01_25490 [Nocardioides psychrotolerans]SFI86856.1 hypothetical protein SAMN05216561_11454 [Nocardioides psychrotolerans]